jgi:4-hydroxybenzoate polyprenyltransferase
MRVEQWVKNSFVLAPLVFAAELTNPSSVIAALAACCSFCFLSSAVYVYNDLLDEEMDRQHPEKRKRPIAAGDISPGAGLWFGLCLLVCSVSIAVSATNSTVIALESAYFLVNIVYSAYLKEVFLVDVFVIGAGFVIRVLAGAYAIGVPASHWVILCTFLLSLFLGFSKRRRELSLLAEKSPHHRGTLISYSPELISSMNLIVCSATFVCYALYTVAADTIAKFGTDRLVYSTPFVLYGLFRYMFLVQSQREGGSPATTLFRDRPLLLCVLLWVAYCSYVVYSAPKGRLP